MSEKLTIRNFTCIHDLEIQLADINVLIGPQASGKSICAKSLYFFKNFIHNLIRMPEQELTKRDFERRILQKFQTYFPISFLGKEIFLLRYDLDDTYIQVERTGEK
jgi:predicted ATPase